MADHSKGECSGWILAPLVLADTYEREGRLRDAEAVRESHAGHGSRVLIPCEEHYPEMYARWRGGHMAPDHDRGHCSSCLEASGSIPKREGRRRPGGARRPEQPELRQPPPWQREEF